MRPARVVAAALLALVIGGAVGLFVLSRAEEQPAPRPFRERTIRIAASIEPRVHLFADPVTARVDLFFDKRRVDPDKISVDAIFQPYEQIGPEQRERSEVGNTVRMRISFPLQCLARACAPLSGRREVQLPPVRVIYTLADVRARANDVSEWPPIDVASRLRPFDIQEARWRADLNSPAVTYAVNPGWLAAGLGGSALVLLLSAGLLAWRLLEGGREHDAGEVPAETRPPLERALEQLGLVSANGDPPARRRALERLARELERVERPTLAARARRLAWSPRQPDRAEVDRLAEDVRDHTGGPV